MTSPKKAYVKNTLLTLLLLCFAQLASAQTIQRLAVANCEEQSGNAGVFFGASYIIAGNMEPGVEFICPIDAETVSPSEVDVVRAFVYVANATDIASVELCFTDMQENTFPSENCGEASLSAGSGIQTIKAGPPKVEKFTDSMVAFIRVWVPAPYGYSFFRGYEVYSNN